MKNLPSNFASLNIKDFLRGLVMGIGTPVLYFVQSLIPNWHIDPILQVGLSALVAYLIKNYFTDSVGAAVAVVQKAEEEQIKNARA